MSLLTKLSGQVTVTTAGTHVGGPDVSGVLFQVQALPGNTGVTYVGNDGADAVSATTGFPLPSAGPGVVLAIDNMNDLRFNSAEDGDKIAWIRLAA